MDSKVAGQKFKQKQDICIVSKYLQQIFSNYKENIVSLQ